MSTPTAAVQPAGPVRAAARRSIDWRRWRWPGAVAVGVLLVAVLAALVLPRSTGNTRLDPGSASPDGSRAVAQILRDQGVQVRRVTRSADAAQAFGG
jgi:hypothetical protein